MELYGEQSLSMFYVVPISALLLMLFFVVEASNMQRKKCTQIVKEERVQYVYQRISVTRKIPAKCSTWDKDWSWLSKKDCTDKYKVVYMNDRKQIKNTRYRIEYVCCPNENGPHCNNNSSYYLAEAGSGKPDTKTLLTILIPVMSAVALVFLISIVIIVVIMRRKKRILEAERQHAYIPVKDKKGKKNGRKKENGASQEKSLQDIGLNDITSDEKLIPFSVEAVDDEQYSRYGTTEMNHYEPMMNVSPERQNGDIDLKIDDSEFCAMIIQGETTAVPTQPSAPPLDVIEVNT